VVLSVRANDKDLPTSQNGMIRYHLGGENSNLFTVDSISGAIKVSGNGVIDREKTPFITLTIFASDVPQGGPDQKISSVPVMCCSYKNIIKIFLGTLIVKLFYILGAN